MPSRSFPDPPEPPEVVGAVFTAGPNVLTVMFDQALVPGAVDVGNWFLRVSGRIWTITAADADSNRVVLGTTVGAVQAGADVVSYSPPPFDVVSALPGGDPAEAFSDFPVTM